MLTTLAACGGGEVVKPSEQRTKAEAAIMRVDQILDAYMDRDMAGVIDKVSSEYKGGYGSLLGRLRKDMEAMDKVEIAYEVERVEMMKDTVGVSVRWDGKWYPKGGKGAVEGRGSSFMVFKDTEIMPLVDIGGDNPLGIIW
jgi:hypothetical protein